MSDRYGVTWPLPDEELCPECGQPDNCGDCSHEPLTRYEVIELGGIPPDGLTVEEACYRAGIDYPGPFAKVHDE